MSKVSSKLAPYSSYLISSAVAGVVALFFVESVAAAFDASIFTEIQIFTNNK